MLLFSLEAGGCNFCFLLEGCSLCFKFDNLDCHAHTDGCNKHSIKDHTHSELTHSVPESGADFGSLSLSPHTHTLLVRLQISSCNVFFLQLPVSPQLGKSLRHYDRIGCLCWWRPAWFWHVVMQGKGVGVRGWMCEGVKKEGLAKDG